MSVERDVEQLLAGLGSAEAPEGMEARIAVRLGNAEVRRSSARAPWIATALAASCILAVVTVGAAWRFAVRARGANNPVADGGSIRAGLRDAGNGRAPQMQGRDEGRDGASAMGLASTAPRKRAEAVEFSRDAEPESEEARVWAEMDAPSMPEKPQPLTRQEILLLRVAKSGDAPAIAATSLDTQAKAREGLMELGQWMSAGLDRSKTEGNTDEETQ